MIKVKICLIGGTGRSGTTILSKILSKHQYVSDVPELRYIVDPDGIIDFYTSCQQWSPYHYDLKLKRLESILRDVSTTGFGKTIAAYVAYPLKKLPWKLRPRYYGISVTRYCAGFQENVRELIQQLSAFSFHGEWIGLGAFKSKCLQYGYPPDKDDLRRIIGNFLRSIFYQILQEQNVEHYLEKNTWNHIWFDKILELLPEARIVHIQRDPRDVVSSYCNQSWMPTNPEQSAIILRDLLRRWEIVKQKVPANSFFEISLEQLVTRPEATLKQICDFYGLDWDDNLMNVNLSKSNQGRWKKHFTPEQQKRIHSILAEDIARLGYE